MSADREQGGFVATAGGYVCREYIPVRHYHFEDVTRVRPRNDKDLFADQKLGFVVTEFTLSRSMAGSAGTVTAVITKGFHPNADHYSNEVRLHHLWGYVSREDLATVVAREWPPKRPASAHLLDTIKKSLEHANIEHSWLKAPDKARLRHELERHPPRAAPAPKPTPRPTPAARPPLPPKEKSAGVADLFDRPNLQLVIVDSNVWMEPRYDPLFRTLEDLLRRKNHKITMGPLQYEEIYSLQKRHSIDSRKGKDARQALTRIEKFQKAGLLSLPNMSTHPNSTAFADPEILTFVETAARQNRASLVISDDKDLRIRAQALGGERAHVVAAKTFGRPGSGL